MWEENPKELLDWKPNLHSAPDGIRTRVPDVEGEARHHYTKLTALWRLTLDATTHISLDIFPETLQDSVWKTWQELWWINEGIA